MQKDIADAFADPELTARSAQSMRRILDSIDAELTPAAAPWAIDRQAFADAHLRALRHRGSRKHSIAGGSSTTARAHS